MTAAFASIIVFRLCLLCGLFAPVAMMAGGDKAATRKAKATQKTTTAKRGETVRRKAGKKKSKVGRSKAKMKKPRHLSVESQRRLDSYFIGRDFPNWKSSSGIPA